MKKLKYIITIAISCITISGCGALNGTSIDDYQSDMALYYENINNASMAIDALDMANENVTSDFLSYIDSIDSNIAGISSLATPSEYKEVKELANEASKAMDKASVLYHEIYDDPSFASYDSDKDNEASQNYINAMNKLNEIGNIIKTKTMEMSNN